MAFDPQTAKVVEGGGFDPSSAKPVRLNPAPTLEEFQAQKPTANESQLVQMGRFARENAPLIGSILGGVAGAAAGPAGSVALGSLLGTTLGTSIGTSARQLARRVQLKETKEPKQALGEYVTNITEQAMYDLVGQGIGKGIATVVEKAVPLAREGADIAQRALRREGGTLTMAQAAESPTFGLAESFARAGAGGKGQFIRLEKRNADAIQAIKDSLIRKMTQGPVDDKVAGKLFQNVIKQGEGAHSSAATALYKDFDNRVGNVLVDTRALREAGQAVADEYARIGNVGKTEAGGRLIDQVKSIGNQLTFSDVHLLRSNLLATTRDLKAAGQETKALLHAGQFLRQAEDAMENAAAKLPGNLYKEYREISSFYRKGKEAFNNDIIRSLMDSHPERVGEELFRSGNVTEIIQAKASLRQAKRYKPDLDPSATLNKLRAGYLNAMLTAKAATTKEGETVAVNMMKELATAKTSRQFQVMFNETQRKAIDEFSRTAFLAASNRPSQFGILAPILQAGAIGLVLAGDPDAKDLMQSGAIIFSPYLLSKVMTNPAAVSILTKGLKLPAGTSPGSSVVVKLADAMTHWMQNPPKEPE